MATTYAVLGLLYRSYLNHYLKAHLDLRDIFMPDSAQVILSTSIGTRQSLGKALALDDDD